jgi:hypothetical protein
MELIHDLSHLDQHGRIISVETSASIMTTAEDGAFIFAYVLLE